MTASEQTPAAARARLSAERIVAEALDLARQEGVRGISMRPLAARFGVSATALYGHVASRDALLGLMLDSILADVPEPAPELGWDEALRDGALNMRDAFGAYPQLLLEALGGHAATALTQTRTLDLLERLRRGGFDEAGASAALACWRRWTMSFLAAAEHTPEGAREDTDRAFEEGIELLLSGLRSRLD